MGAVLATSAAACLTGTQLTIHVFTNAACTPTAGLLHFDQLGITAGEPGTLDVRSPAGTSSTCGALAPGSLGAGYGPNDLGTLALTPKGAKDSPVEVIVVASVDGANDPLVDLSVCETWVQTGAVPAPYHDSVSGDATGPILPCLVARRSLTFTPHASFELPIQLDATCLGVSCPAGSTCEQHVCVPEKTVCTQAGGCMTHGTGGSGSSSSASSTSAVTSTSSGTGCAGTCVALSGLTGWNGPDELTSSTCGAVKASDPLLPKVFMPSAMTCASSCNCMPPDKTCDYQLNLSSSAGCPAPSTNSFPVNNGNCSPLPNSVQAVRSVSVTKATAAPPAPCLASGSCTIQPTTTELCTVPSTGCAPGSVCVSPAVKTCVWQKNAAGNCPTDFPVPWTGKVYDSLSTIGCSCTTVGQVNCTPQKAWLDETSSACTSPTVPFSPTLPCTDLPNAPATVYGVKITPVSAGMCGGSVASPGNPGNPVYLCCTQ